MKKQINLNTYNQLVKSSNKYIKLIKNSKTKLNIKRLRFLIKKKKSTDEKYKLFSLINLYLNDTTNIYLSNYLIELYNEIEDNQDLK